MAIAPRRRRRASEYLPPGHYVRAARRAAEDAAEEDERRPADKAVLGVIAQLQWGWRNLSPLSRARFEARAWEALVAALLKLPRPRGPSLMYDEPAPKPDHPHN